MNIERDGIEVRHSRAHMQERVSLLYCIMCMYVCMCSTHFSVNLRALNSSLSMSLSLSFSISVSV